MKKFQVEKSRFSDQWILWYPDDEYGYFPSWAAAMAAIDKIVFAARLHEVIQAPQVNYPNRLSVRGDWKAYP